MPSTCFTAVISFHTWNLLWKVARGIHWHSDDIVAAENVCHWE